MPVWPHWQSFSPRRTLAAMLLASLRIAWRATDAFRVFWNELMHSNRSVMTVCKFPFTLNFVLKIPHLHCNINGYFWNTKKYNNEFPYLWHCFVVFAIVRHNSISNHLLGYYKLYSLYCHYIRHQLWLLSYSHCAFVNVLMLENIVKLYWKLIGKLW